MPHVDANKCYNSSKQLINHKGGTRNKRTVERTLRTIEIVDVAAQNAVFQTDLRDSAFANNYVDKKCFSW